MSFLSRIARNSIIGFQSRIKLSAVLLLCSPAFASEQPEIPTAKYDGLYWVELYPAHAMGDFNIACVGGRGHMEIINNLITGSIISNQLLSFKVEGEIDEFGSIAGGIALSAGVVASYEGRHRSTSGRGSWKTDNGCTGRWKARLATTSVNKSERIAIYEQLNKSLCREPLVECLSETQATCASALKESLTACHTLLKMDPNSVEATQISQCVSQQWVSALRVPQASLRVCSKQLMQNGS